MTAYVAAPVSQASGAAPTVPATREPTSSAAWRSLLFQDRLGIADVCPQVGGRALAGADEHRPGVRDDDGVVVHVNDAGFQRDTLRNLVRVVERRQPRPQVEELADAGLACQVPDDPSEVGPIGPDVMAESGLGRGEFVGHRTVGREVVLAAEQRVVHPGGIGRVQVTGGWLQGGFLGSEPHRPRTACLVHRWSLLPRAVCPRRDHLGKPISSARGKLIGDSGFNALFTGFNAFFTVKTNIGITNCESPIRSLAQGSLGGLAAISVTDGGGGRRAVAGDRADDHALVVEER